MDSGLDYGLLLDGLIAVLLIATIAYAAMLNRQLAALRNNRVELERASRNFAEAAINADANLKMLRSTADQTGRQLQAQIDRATKLSDELRLMVDAGEVQARGMVGDAPSIRPVQSGAAATAAAPIEPAEQPEPAGAGGPASEPGRMSARERLARARRAASGTDAPGQPTAAAQGASTGRRRSARRSGGPAAAAEASAGDAPARDAPARDALPAIETLR